MSAHNIIIMPPKKKAYLKKNITKKMKVRRIKKSQTSISINRILTKEVEEMIDKDIRRAGF